MIKKKQLQKNNKKIDIWVQIAVRIDLTQNKINILLYCLLRMDQKQKAFFIYFFIYKKETKFVGQKMISGVLELKPTYIMNSF